MANKKKKDRIVKKIKKNHKGNRNPILEKKMGAPSNENRDLTEKQKELGKLIGLGLKESEVQEKLSFSAYQMKEYLSLPKVIDIIQKYNDLKGQDRLTRYNNLWGDIETEALLELQKRIRKPTESKFPDNLLMKIVNRTFIQAAVREDQEDQENEVNEVNKVNKVNEIKEVNKDKNSKLHSYNIEQKSDSLFSENDKEEKLDET